MSETRCTGRWAVVEVPVGGYEDVTYTVAGRTPTCMRSLVLFHRRQHAEGLAGALRAERRAAGLSDGRIRVTRMPRSVFTQMAEWGD